METSDGDAAPVCTNKICLERLNKEDIVMSFSWDNYVFC